MSKSKIEEAFWTGWLLHAPSDAPVPEREARFHPTRRWRADFLWRDARVFVSIEGKVWGALVRCDMCRRYVTKKRRGGSRYRVREAGGRHYRGGGIASDVEKYNMLASLGYVRIIGIEPMVKAAAIEKTIQMVARIVLSRHPYGCSADRCAHDCPECFPIGAGDLDPDGCEDYPGR